MGDPASRIGSLFDDQVYHTCTGAEKEGNSCSWQILAINRQQIMRSRYITCTHNLKSINAIMRSGYLL